MSDAAARPDGRIRVVYLLWSGGLGGAERHVYDLASALPRERFSVTVCFFAARGIYGDRLESRGIAVREIGLRRGSDLRGALRYARWLRRAEIDIVHDHLSTPWSPAVTARLRPDCAILATAHSGLLLKGYGFWRRFWCRVNTRHTRTTIAVSQAVRRALLRIVPWYADRIIVLPNFVDAGRFPARTDEDRASLARALDLPAGARVLLSVGRLNAEKGFDRLLSLLLPVFRRHPDLMLLVAGEGALRPFLQAESARLGLGSRVRLLGARSDVPSLCDLSETVVFASRVESFGIAAAEAMMAGRPVVGLRIPGLEEVVESGRTGMLVDPDRSEVEFPAAVERLLADATLRREMGRAGREAALERFERRTVVARIARLYEETLADRGGGGSRGEGRRGA